MMKGKSRTRISGRDLLKTNSKRSKPQIRDRTRTKAKFDRRQYDGHNHDKEQES